MSFNFNSCTKLCVTCNYWMGPRMPNQWANQVIVDEQSVKGKCWCLNGPHARADRYSNTCSCSRYEKWSVLK